METLKEGKSCPSTVLVGSTSYWETGAEYVANVFRTALAQIRVEVSIICTESFIYTRNNYLHGAKSAKNV
jgi:hypothetical protein